MSFLAVPIMPARLVRASTPGWLPNGWNGIGLRREEYGTHSLRRTKAFIIYKASGNLRAVQIVLGHAEFENTVRYLGVDV